MFFKEGIEGPFVAPVGGPDPLFKEVTEGGAGSVVGSGGDVAFPEGNFGGVSKLVEVVDFSRCEAKTWRRLASVER